MVGILTVVSVIGTLLKLSGHLDIGWVWVCIPVILDVALTVLSLVVVSRHFKKMLRREL